MVAHAEPASKRRRTARSKHSDILILGSETVTIVVGTEKKKFAIHACLLDDPWNKLPSVPTTPPITPLYKAIHMPDVQVDHFEIYSTWLYTGRICTNGTKDSGKTMIQKADDNRKGDAEDMHHHGNRVIAGCLVLAERIKDDKFYNAAVDCLVEECKETGLYPVGAARYLYGNLSHKSPVKQLLVDFWVWHGHLAWFLIDNGDAEKGPQSFWVAVAKGLILKKAKAKEPWLRDRCHYHIHNEKTPKCVQEW